MKCLFAAITLITVVIITTKIMIIVLLEGSYFAAIAYLTAHENNLPAAEV